MNFSIFLHKFSKNRIDIQYFGKYSKSHGAISIFTIQIDFYCAHELYACFDAIFYYYSSFRHHQKHNGAIFRTLFFTCKSKISIFFIKMFQISQIYDDFGIIPK